MANNEDVDAILARGRITADDVLTLRRRVFLKGVVTADDAEMVFLLNERLEKDADPAWAPFFVEALVDYLVFQVKPSGYISDQNAEWLIAHISRSGHVQTGCELELLVKALEEAKSSPVRLVAFALQQVKQAVLSNEGYLGSNRALGPGVVSLEDTELVRRIVYAFGGDGNVAVTRQEAAMLFDINDATSEVENHPAWSDLFVKAIANFLMGASGYQVPVRQEALRREAWLDAPTPGVGVFMSQMLAGSLSAIWDAYRQGTLDGEPRKAGGPSRVSLDAPPRATADDARWAAARLGHDGHLHQNELALIAFLKQNGASLHPYLAPVLEHAAA